MAAAKSNGLFGNTSVFSFIKAGFGLGLGSYLAFILLLIIGVAIFVPGYILFTKEKKSDKPNKAKQVVGIILMIIGCVIGLGFGGTTAIGSIGDMMD